MDFNKKMELEHKRLFEEYTGFHSTSSPDRGYFEEVVRVLELATETRVAFVNKVLEESRYMSVYLTYCEAQLELLRELMERIDGIVFDKRVARKKRG